jgi:DNA polymerase III subunit alpha
MIGDKNYTVLHCHTMLSNGVTNIDSVTKYTDYINKAVECDMKALAFSEHGSFLSIYTKKRRAKRQG